MLTHVLSLAILALIHRIGTMNGQGIRRLLSSESEPQAPLRDCTREIVMLGNVDWTPHRSGEARDWRGPRNRADAIKRCIFVIVLLGSLSCCLVFSRPCYAQPGGSDASSIERFLAEPYNLIKGWETKAMVALSLVILVGALGIVTAILQGYNKQWCKSIVVVVGIVISLTTLVNNEVFDTDHRTLNKMAKHGHKILSTIHYLALQLDTTNPETRKTIFEDIQKLIQKIYELEEGPEKSEKKASFNIISLSYAGQTRQERQSPSWISEIPSDESNLYFVGIWDSSSLKDAQDFSYKDAIDQIIDYLTTQIEKGQQQKQVELDTKALAEYLTRSVQVETTHFTVDPKQNTYRYYTLIKLNKRLAGVNIKLFAIQSGTIVSPGVSSSIAQAKRSSDDYVARRQTAYTNLFDTAKEIYSGDVSEKFNEARKLRKEQKYEKAIDILEEITRARPDFYLAWYNLALAYDALDKSNLAGQAYEKAKDLEPRQVSRDPSLYNSYGFFLYRNERYADAIKQLEKALELDPGHPKAKRTLEEARKRNR